MTMNDHWGYNKHDQNWKSSATMIRKLIDIASKGGNYLLNVGPTAEGLIPEPSVERLARDRQVDEASTARRSTAPRPARSRRRRPGAASRRSRASSTCTSSIGPRTAGWSWRKRAIKPVTAAYLLADPQRTPLKVTQSQDGVELAVPAQAPDPVASVVVLETSENPTGRPRSARRGWPSGRS